MHEQLNQNLEEKLTQLIDVLGGNGPNGGAGESGKNDKQQKSMKDFVESKRKNFMRQGTIPVEIKHMVKG